MGLFGLIGQLTTCKFLGGFSVWPGCTGTCGGGGVSPFFHGHILLVEKGKEKDLWSNEQHALPYGWVYR